MDSTRFDEVAKRLATSRSRRTVLRGLGRGMAAGAIGAFAITRLQPASAAPTVSAPRPEGHPCEGNQVCADGLYCLISGPGQSRRCAVCDVPARYFNGDCFVCPAGSQWSSLSGDNRCINECGNSIPIPVPPVRKYDG